MRNNHIAACWSNGEFYQLIDLDSFGLGGGGESLKHSSAFHRQESSWSPAFQPGRMEHPKAREFTFSTYRTEVSTVCPSWAWIRWFMLGAKRILPV